MVSERGLSSKSSLCIAIRSFLAGTNYLKICKACFFSSAKFYYIFFGGFAIVIGCSECAREVSVNSLAYSTGTG